MEAYLYSDSAPKTTTDYSMSVSGLVSARPDLPPWWCGVVRPCFLLFPRAYYSFIYFWQAGGDYSCPPGHGGPPSVVVAVRPGGASAPAAPAVFVEGG